jgi:hypothetical protein
LSLAKSGEKSKNRNRITDVCKIFVLRVKFFINIKVKIVLQREKNEQNAYLCGDTLGASSGCCRPLGLRHGHWRTFGKKQKSILGKAQSKVETC